jgi:hypothetical protein
MNMWILAIICFLFPACKTIVVNKQFLNEEIKKINYTNGITKQQAIYIAQDYIFNKESREDIQKLKLNSASVEGVYNYWNSKESYYVVCVKYKLNFLPSSILFSPGYHVSVNAVNGRVEEAISNYLHK